MLTIKNLLVSANWWVGPGLLDEDDRPLTWCVYGGLDECGNSRTVGEFESKTLADHVAKTHNSATRKR